MTSGLVRHVLICARRVFQMVPVISSTPSTQTANGALMYYHYAWYTWILWYIMPSMRQGLVTEFQAAARKALVMAIATFFMA